MVASSWVPGPEVMRGRGDTGLVCGSEIKEVVGVKDQGLLVCV